ncbi:MAG: ATP-binding protein [Gammaproteobacteria bacterium]|nr:ATP-binding protein [Gammaproteobacteria bacterium]
MACVAEEITADSRLLDQEWTRVGLMLTLAEALRTGAEFDESFSKTFASVGDVVAAKRSQGAWGGLSRSIDDMYLDRFLQVDLDILALALAADARPAFGPRIQSLQPHVTAPYPSLALVQELLMLDDSVEVAALYERLEPTAPLVASGLVRVSGEGPYQLVRATPAAQLAVFGRATDVAPPPGANLETRRGRWHDLVLPAATLRALHDFTAWLKRREQIVAWGGRPSGGPLALFSGASGTGKSYAAMVIAAELAAETGEPWALYTLDLGRIMSKYVGETEENLNQLLDALDGRRAILQIDEADGLLGKRGEVSDARDRYANLEVSHMLSRFERHVGPVILTSNLRSNIDPAFLRRFQMVIDFPSPDKHARAQLWSLLLPPAAPRDTDLDLDQLAGSARLSGGAIQNAAHYAAVLAAEERAAIAPRHVARAVWAELGKENRQIRRSEIGVLASHLEEDGTCESAG